LPFCLLLRLLSSFRLSVLLLSLHLGLLPFTLLPLPLQLLLHMMASHLSLFLLLAQGFLCCLLTSEKSFCGIL
jgi:hypothetical protein